MAEKNSSFSQSDGSAGGQGATRTDLYREWLDMAVLTPIRVAWDDWRTQVGSIIIAFYLLMGSVGVVLVDPPNQGQGPRLTPAFQDWSVPLGTNDIGESILSATVHATPPMLQMIAAGAVFSTALATVIGTVSGYKGGLTDRVLTTLTDIAMTIPGLPLIILLAALFEPTNPAVIGILITINAWAGLARSIRSQVLSLRDHSYVEASRIMGAPTRRILVDDIIPNIMPYVLINFVNSARNVIFGSVGLYYLGLLGGTHENWGIMLDGAYNGGAIYSLQVVHWLFVPMIAIIGISFGFVLFAQGTEKLFNPRIRARHAETVEDDTAPHQQ
ncbi:ABC transporter permease [Halosimplex rubrum]|uniref:ABC transporter permease n=1 Tax=Halosimplex rubrum TaxID=869889 RepID=A0A7D5P7I5_9EURY|nr:ABC transporter permease [Halosimplex rubrum]QLH79785.1 ABC transporter permease [Halosimplex rubrum]